MIVDTVFKIRKGLLDEEGNGEKGEETTPSTEASEEGSIRSNGATNNAVSLDAAIA